MLVVIPMAGFGDRFRRAGFQRPKPLIEVDGRPMIEHVVRGFPGADRFLFIVNRSHLETTDLGAVLGRLAPGAPVVPVEPHKDGPVETLLRAEAQLPDDDDVLVNYCDFGARWSFPEFRRWLAGGGWDGAMTAYRGFHPHSLGPTLYAYLQHDDETVTAIREKGHFTANRMQEPASSGLYWFRSGRTLKALCHELVARGERVNGEFYASMLMDRLLARGGRVGWHELDAFFQWGTPEDLRDYQSWSDSLANFREFRTRVAAAGSRTPVVVPMAGRGQRFRDEGYPDPKPFIDVAGAPMVVQALRSLPPSPRVLVTLPEFAAEPGRAAALQALENTREIVLAAPTDGQAVSAAAGVSALPPDAPVLIAPCDAAFTYDLAAWLELERATDAELVVWTAAHHAPAHWKPASYGWVASADLQRISAVTQVAVKRAVDGVPLAQQETITGVFWFRRASTFLAETEAMRLADDRVNGELYVDTLARRLVEAGRKVLRFRVDKWLSFGTPDELRTFAYWNRVFRAGSPL
jgi:NDP-sugar pyrophosphorylase family protein